MPVGTFDLSKLLIRTIFGVAFLYISFLACFRAISNGSNPLESDLLDLMLFNFCSGIFGVLKPIINLARFEGRVEITLAGSGDDKEDDILLPRFVTFFLTYGFC